MTIHVDPNARLDAETSSKEGAKAQAVAARVLRTYADPATRALAVLESQAAMVAAYITEGEEGEREVTFFCTGCKCIIEPNRVAWHRMHGNVSLNH